MIREARLCDAREIFEILEKTDDPWTMGVIESEITSQNSFFYVYEEASEVLAFADIKILFDEADLMHIAVREDKRNMGLAKKLLEHIINIADEKKLPIALEVRAKNYKAINLYENFDFMKEGIRKNYYHGEDAVLMWRRK